MDNLQTFRERTLALAHAANPFPDNHRPTIEDLAREIGLSRTELSRRLSGKGKVPLSCANVEAIVRALAKWGALQTQAAAIELLALGHCPGFKAEEWQQPPLNQLAPSSQHVASRPHHAALGNLPLPLTSFVGREQEIAELRERLTSTRLLTITGAGGMGKTRLAIELGLSLRDEYADGCWMVNLTPLRDRSMAMCAIALELTVHDEPGRDVEQTLTDYLRPRRLLLVLDNCEHLLDAIVAPVKLLLENCPNLHILATSRQALGLSGTAEWRLSPLPLPSAAPQLSPLQAQSYAAVALFVARAQAALPHFRLNGHNVGGVVQICQQLDGIPLALELAAPLLKALSVEQIAQRLSDRFRLLRNADPAAPTRQQTLRASIEWSYDLLDEQERALLRRLAVFGYGWNIEAAEAICPDPVANQQSLESTLYSLRADAVLAGHIQLVNKSLLQVGEYEGVARYTMLDTIRQFAAECLAQSGEEQQIRQRHASLYIAFAEQAASEWVGAKQVAWLDRLEQENGNLRVALGWWLSQGESEMALRMGVALWRFWLVHGHREEGSHWLRQILAIADNGGALRAEALAGLGSLYVVDHNYVAARQCHEQAVAIYREQKDETGLAVALNNLGESLRLLDEPAAARACYEEGVALAAKQADKTTLARLSYGLGALTFTQGDYDAAHQYHTQALSMHQQMNDENGLAYSLAALGALASVANDYAAARNFYEQSIALFEQLGNQRNVAIISTSAGMAATEQGEYEDASRFFNASLAISQGEGNAHAIAETLTGYAILAAACCPPDEAVLLFGAAEARRDAAGVPIPLEDRQHYERHLAATRTQLDEAAFNSAWSRGRTLSETQAIVYALKLPIPTATARSTGSDKSVSRRFQ